ncbi:MAG: CDGSH iron-sulfur domain-containing protein, partial [Betaproteobacteria bacterium]|nr:CDGSH iron-sulfur domain-containing protein [Betaproteobacteria bacterium]
MNEPVIAQTSPFAVQVEADKTYWWCACGKSANQPFCDGSHKASGFTPLKH